MKNYKNRMASLEKIIPEKKVTVPLNLTEEEITAAYEQAGKSESPELEDFNAEELAKIYRSML